MKKGIHPENYKFVVFKDMSNGTTFLTRSGNSSKETIKWEDGNEYPIVKLEISNTSHPFYTGQNMLVDTAGRIDKFKKKYAKKYFQNPPNGGFFFSYSSRRFDKIEKLFHIPRRREHPTGFPSAYPHQVSLRPQNWYFFN